MREMKVYNPDTSTLKGNMLLEASAGTGKTYALERMVARLVSEGPAPLEIGSILVVTFTNRAAREMKERIRSLLALRSADSSRPEQERQNCARALSDFDKAPIYTIHGFCQMVLSTWPFESDSPFGQELEPGGALELSETRSWIASLGPDDIDGTLLRAAYASEKSVEALIALIAEEVTREKTFPGTVILPGEEDMKRFSDALVFSQKTDSPLAEASGKLFVREWSDQAILTVIKAAKGARSSKTAKSLELIRQHFNACRDASGLNEISSVLFGDPSRAGISNHFTDLFKAGVACIRGEAVNPEAIDSGSEAESLAVALESLLCAMEPFVEAFGGAGGSIETLVDRYLRRAFLDPAVTIVRKRVEEKKNAEGRWGYADLIQRVADAVEPKDSPLRVLLKRRFSSALIDEFQDTDPRQWALFYNLFGDDSHLLALIGDPKQCIYGFRGTGLQAYNEAKKIVAGDSMYRLDTNYRSVPKLVSAVNSLFSPLFSEACGSNKPVGFQTVSAGKSTALDPRGLEGAAPIHLVNAPHRSSAEGGLVGSASDAIVGEIRKLLDPSSNVIIPFDKGIGEIQNRGLSASDIAVLVRTSAQEDAVLERLARAGIPAIRIRSRSVFSRPVTPLLLSFLEALERPRDIRRWKTLLSGEFFRLPPSLLFRFETEGRLDEFVERGGIWRESLLEGRITEVLDKLFRFSVTVASWAEESGRADITAILDRPWPHRLLAGPEGERHWQDWNQLTELVQKKQAEGLREPTELIAWISRSVDTANTEGSDDAVRIETESPAVRVMTMHASKGLEFPLVFLLGGLTQKTRRGRDREYRYDVGGSLTVDQFHRESNRDSFLAYSWEETKRLWYVAFTRASRALWLIRPEVGPFTVVDSLLAEATGFISCDDLPPHELLNTKDGEALRVGLNKVLEDRATGPEPVFNLPATDLSELSPLVTSRDTEFNLAALPSAGTAFRDPATSSYTSLTRNGSGHRDGKEGDEKDVDRHTGETETFLIPAGSEDNLFEELPLASDRGALFGTLVHTLYEESSFSLAGENEETWYGDEPLDDLYRTLSGRYYHPDWYRSRSHALKKIVRSALRSPLPGLGRLCDQEDQDMRAEVEFLMSVPRNTRISSDDRNIMMPGGFLKGFIDLLVFSKGKWWVLDWKTNVPKGTRFASEYQPEVLEGMMDSHQYHLQYELYLLSLCRTLSSSRGIAVDWESEIGGAQYLFVRGMREEDDRGVFFCKPGKDRMLDLASTAGLEGVLV